MDKIKVYNGYAGLGGNRKLLPNDKIEVTAVEINPDIAKIYQSFFPDDKVIVGDAHQYLLEHYKEFDFIWSSPPCQSHSVCNHFLKGQGIIRYPDMRLYEEIILLQTHAKCKWVVENTHSYYEPLIKPQSCGRHYFWSNFLISEKNFNIQIGRMNGNQQQRKRIIREAQIPELVSLHDINITNVNIKNKRQILRNCVQPRLGLYIFECAFARKQKVLFEELNK